MFLLLIEVGNYPANKGDDSDIRGTEALGCLRACVRWCVGVILIMMLFIMMNVMQKVQKSAKKLLTMLYLFAILII